LGPVFRIGYVELASIELVEKAIALSGTIVMGLPILVELTEAERNKQAASNTPALLTPLPGAPAIG
jgi:RNA-binding protein 39